MGKKLFRDNRKEIAVLSVGAADLPFMYYYYWLISFTLAIIETFFMKYITIAILINNMLIKANGPKSNFKEIP